MCALVSLPHACDRSCCVFINPTSDTFNSSIYVFIQWGASWGEKGYIRMQRNVNKTGICGIAMQASYPVKAKGPAPPIPPTSPPTPAATYKCGCTASCVKTAAAFGMECCCGANGDCHISQHVAGCCAPCKN